MLFHSSIRNELARSFGATRVVLTTLVMTLMLTRTLQPSPLYLGELAWRIGWVIAAMNLGVIALAITSANQEPHA